ncbi:MAG TPA: hypothetical protein VEZ12_21030 [Herpetosiphonaceae bacterium]|nr:hypothetical protein [Herpetosiphonaceae bacterium]
MDFVFLDANVLFSAAYRVDSRLRRLWQLRKAQLLTSSFAEEEARRNFATPRQRSELDMLLESIRIVAFSGPLDHPIFSTIVLPDKDRPILLAALTARATHLLAGDLQHFGPYFGQRIEGVLILPPAEYLRTVSTGEEP